MVRPLRQTVRRATRQVSARYHALHGHLDADAEFDLHVLLSEVMAQFMATHEGPVRTTLEILRGTPDIVVGQKDLLYPALVHLVGNARRCTVNGTVELRCNRICGRPDARVVRFAVIDTGSGDRLDYSGKHLAAARLAVALLGGRLNVQCTPGIGSVVQFEVEFRAPVETGNPGVEEPDESPALPAPAVAIPELGRVDPAPLKDLLAMSGDKAFAEHLIAGFEADSRALLRHMGEAVAAQDWAVLQDHAHAMAGSSTALGLVAVSAVSRQIQQASDEALGRNAGALFAKLVAEFGPSLVAVREAAADLVGRGVASGSGP
jgi:HPt (histidine-containing phosphotransfer) domain-containing protein